MKKITAAVFAAFAFSAISTAQTTVYSNNIGGDNFTNATASTVGQSLVNSPTQAAKTFFFNTNDTAQWQYNDVRNGGSVGINTTYARSGNGSAQISTPSGTSTQSSIAFTAAPAASPNLDATGYLGMFNKVTNWAYDFMRASGNSATMTPVARIELRNMTNFDYYGNLVYIPGSAANIGTFGGSFTNNTWYNVDIIATDGSLWLSRDINVGGTDYVKGTTKTYSEWQTILGDIAGVSQFNAGVGSHSNNDFDGAVDNYQIGIDGSNLGLGVIDETYNFEAVPEPATMTVLGLLALLKRRKAKKNKA